MKKALFAIDATKGSKKALLTFSDELRKAEEVIILHVEQLEGRSLMTAMLGDTEMSTLKESLTDSEHKEALDRKAEKIIAYYKEELENIGQTVIEAIITAGNPADEILKVAAEKEVNIIVLGSNGKNGLSRLITGSVSEEVQRNAEVPVLVPLYAPACRQVYDWRDAFYAMTVFSLVLTGLFILGLIL
ncbi:MAG: universal stress protein [Nitrospirae bacterium]|nr:universal stress protein [Nitrospirota bacterium]